MAGKENFFEIENIAMIYHISNSGDYTNPGTHEKPWRTLARANAENYTGITHILL